MSSSRTSDGDPRSMTFVPSASTGLPFSSWSISSNNQHHRASSSTEAEYEYNIPAAQTGLPISSWSVLDTPSKEPTPQSHFIPLIAAEEEEVDDVPSPYEESERESIDAVDDAPSPIKDKYKYTVPASIISGVSEEPVIRSQFIPLPVESAIDDATSSTSHPLMSGVAGVACNPAISVFDWPCFVLSIGIDEYRNVSHLRGGVRDAQKFGDFIKERFPKASVEYLLNENATRDKIIDSLEALSKNDLIKRGNTIIIFFAGHGSRVDVKLPGGRSKKVESLVPYDVTWDDGGNPAAVSPIADYEIKPIINKLSSSRGNNITLIFDCCYSAGTNREGGRRPRAVDGLSPLISQEVDEADTTSDVSRRAIFAGSWKERNNASHVLIAACTAEQRAWEDSDGGLFTNALLKVLRRTENTLFTLDYASLVIQPEFQEISKDYPQTAVCDGANIKRALFQGQVPHDYSSHFISGWRNGSSLILNAGHAQRVREGATYQIVNRSLEPLIEATVTRIAATGSVLKPLKDQPNSDKIQIPDVFLAEEVGPHPEATIMVYCDHRLELEKCLLSALPDRTVGLEAVGIKIQDSNNKADLIVTLGQNEFAYDLRTRLDAPYQYLRLSGKTQIHESQSVLQVIKSAQRFLFHLQHTKESNQVKIELTELEEDELGIDMASKTKTNLFENNIAILPVKRNNSLPYGVTIRNSGTHSLIPYLLTFNGSDLSITSWHMPPIVAGRKTPLDDLVQPETPFDIGHNESGTRPRWIVLEEESDLDITWCKLYITTKPGDFSFITQKSPFQKDVNLGTTSDTLNTDDIFEIPKELVSSQNDKWETVVGVVIQRLDSSNKRDISGAPRPMPPPASNAGEGSKFEIYSG